MHCRANAEIYCGAEDKGSGHHNCGDAASEIHRVDGVDPHAIADQDALVGRKLKGLLAAALVCPLSLEIFQDPVIAADGHSYERREIEAWLARGKTTSPKTNAELPHAFLVPNRHLKAMCQQFLDEVREVEEAGG